MAVFCPQCGGVVPDGAPRCPCGRSLDLAAAPPAGPAAGRLLHRSLLFYREHFLPLVLVGGVWWVPLLGGVPFPIQAGSAYAAAVVLTYTCMIFLGHYATIWAAAEFYRGHPVGVRAALMHITSGRFLRATGTMVLGLLIVSGAFALLVLPGVFLAVRYALVLPVVLIEERSGLDALRQSGRLVRGRWWWVLIALLLFLLAERVIRVMTDRGAGMVLGILGLGVEGLPDLLGETVAQPLGSVGLTLLYFDLRGRADA